jgi:PilZ domain
MTNAKIRRSGRMYREIPIQLLGTAADGAVFVEETRTVILSRHGAAIVSRRTLVAEQELTLRSRETEMEAEIRVVGEIGMEDGEHRYGVAFVDRVLDFWGIRFPMPASREEAATISLSCNGCGNFATLEYGEFEEDICAIHGGLVRYCTQCGLSTMWRIRREVSLPKIAARVAKVGTTKSSAGVALLEEKKIAAITTKQESGAERRQRVRAKVNFFACVRTEAYGDDVVKCLDMSRGGLSFKTSKVYGRGDLVRIAVPFSPEDREAPAIFVAGQIVNARETGADGYRCGVAYLTGSDWQNPKSDPGD